MLDAPVHVHVPDVGGAFGMKGPFYPEYGPVAAAAMRLGRDVMWTQTRREHLQGGTHGRGQHTTVRLAGDADGTLRWGHVTMVGDVGAYPVGANVTTFSRRVSAGLYDLQNFRVETKTVVTNRAPTGPYRGAGRPEAAYAIERAVDAFARKAGLDPVEVRLKNYVTEWPYQSVPGALYDSGDYAATLRTAMSHVDIEAIRAEQAERLATGRDPIGFGLGTFVERAGGPVQGGEYGRVEVYEDGTAVAFTGSVSGGQGHETVWARIAADAMGLPYDKVSVQRGDTMLMPRSSGSSASRSTQLGGSAMYNTGVAIRRRATELAADMLEAAAADIVLDNGVFSVAGSPGSELTYAEVAAEALRRETPLTEDEWFAPGAQTFPYGAHAAVVEVEMETGFVQIRQIVAVDDCGNIINPMIVEGQIHGSLMQGIGQALFEGMEYSDDGQLRTSTFMDYQMPRAGDQPPFITDRVITPAPSNPLGAKGTGEAGCIGAPPAIVNAVLDALAPYGVEHIDMPLKPATVWTAIKAAAQQRV
jgi:carbon-monoxide dehydrogenase large subunit